MSELDQTRQAVRDNFKLLREQTAENMDNMAQLAEEMAEHISRKDNPHDTTKHDVDLGDMQNYPAATEEQAIEGEDHDAYLLANQMPVAYGRQALDGGSILDIRTPEVISPKAGIRTSSRYPTLKGGPYGRTINRHGIVVMRKHREFQYALATQEFGDQKIEVDADEFTFEQPLAVNAEYKWRIRDVDTGNVTSTWSREATFVTAEGEWLQPTISVSGEAGVFTVHVSDVNITPTGLFSHEATEIEVAYDASFNDIALRAEFTDNITTVPVSTLPDERDVHVRARVTGGGLEYSDWSNVITFNTGISEANVFEIVSGDEIVIVDGDESVLAGYATGSPAYPYIARRDVDTGTVTQQIRLLSDQLVGHTFLRVVEYQGGYVGVLGHVGSKSGTHLVKLSTGLEIAWSITISSGIHDLAIDTNSFDLLITGLQDNKLVVSKIDVTTGDISASKLYGHGDTELGHNSITWSEVSGLFTVFGQTTDVIDLVNNNGDRSVYIDELNGELNPVGEIRFLTIDKGEFADVANANGISYLFVNTATGVNIGSFNNNRWVTLTNSDVKVTSAMGLGADSIVCTGVLGDQVISFQVSVSGGRVTSVTWGTAIGNVESQPAVFTRSGRTEFATKDRNNPNKSLVFSIQPGSAYDVVPSRADIVFNPLSLAVAEVNRVRARIYSPWGDWQRVNNATTRETTTASTPAVSGIVVPGNSSLMEYRNPRWVGNGTYTAYGTWTLWNWVNVSTRDQASRPSASQISMPSNSAVAEHRNRGWIRGNPDMVSYDTSRDTGYLGTFAASALWTGTQLASAVGLSAGTAFNSDINWLGFYVGPNATCNKEGGKAYVMYVPQRPHRYNLSWNQINAAGVALGNVKTVSKSGHTYKVRLLSGGVTNNYGRSEWNQLIYRVHQMVPNGAEDFSGGSQVGNNWANFTDAQLGVNYLAVSNGNTSWCMERSNNDFSSRVDRGHLSIAYAAVNASSRTNTHFGWRSALVLVLD